MLMGGEEKSSCHVYTDIDGLNGGELKLISQNFPAKVSNLLRE
jgi:hypothetical protein